MSETWHQHKIGDLFDYTIPGEWGGEPKLNREVPVIRSTNFTNDGKLDLSRIVLRDVPASRLEKRTVERGDILFEKSGGGPSQPAGRVAYCGGDFCGTCSNFIEIAKVKKKFDSEFVAFLLHSLYKEGLILKYQQQTTGIINFKLNEYKQEIVKVPDDKAQQSKIAQVLSTLDRAIAQSESLLVKQHRVKAGLMQELLTRGIDAAGNRRDPSTHAFKDSPLGPIPVEWQSVPCSNLASKITKGTTPSTYGYSYTTSGVTYIRVEAIKADGTFNKEALLKISETAHRLLSRSELMPGDVLVTIAGAIGRCAVVNKSLLPANCNQAVAIVRVKLGEVIPEYLRLFFSSAIWQNYALAETVQLAQANISLGQLGKSFVALPPMEEQERICAIAASETLQVDNGTKSLKKLKSIKAGLMQDLLTGRVSVLPLFGESI